jgi:hypothetical protein
MKPRTKERLSRALIACASLTIALALAELAARRLGVLSTFHAFDRARGWTLRPGLSGRQDREGHAQVEINADGLRGPRAAPEKPSNVLRVAVLGDSFIEAFHVPYEKNLCPLIKDELQVCPRLGGRPVEVLNFGVSGYGTAQELLTLRGEVWRYAPDIVVLAVYSRNDLSDNMPDLRTPPYFSERRCRPHFVERDGRLELVRPYEGRGFLPFFCRFNFAARRLSLVRLLGSSAEAAARLRRRGEDRGQLSEPGAESMIYAPPGDDPARRAWALTERLIATVAREVRSKGARFLVLVVDNPEQVYPDPEYRRRYLQLAGGTDIFYPNRRLAALGEKEGFDVLEAAPAMQLAADHGRLFFHGFDNTAPGTGHWNERGHAFVGRMIARALCAPPRR